VSEKQLHDSAQHFSRSCSVLEPVEQDVGQEHEAVDRRKCCQLGSTGRRARGSRRARWRTDTDWTTGASFGPHRRTRGATARCPADLYQPHTHCRIKVCAIDDGWLGNRVVSVLYSGAEGPGFKSQSRRCQITVLGKLFTPIVPPFTKQQNWQQPSLGLWW